MTTGEVEARAKGNKTYVEGYAAVFERRSGNLGGFVEVVKPTAFNRTMQQADVRALWNHDPSLVLGRNKSGTLELSQDEKGLYYRSELPNTSYAHDLFELLERRDITQSSFTFFKVQDDWELVKMGDEDYPQRSLLEVGLVDVSPVTFPAYEDATSGPSRRAAFDGLAKRSAIDVDFFANRADITDIKRAIQKLQDSGEPQRNRDNAAEPRKATSVTEDAARITVPRGLSQEEIDEQFREELKKFTF